jgi:hypothetical protein
MIGPDWLMYKEGFFVNLVGMDIPGFTLIHLNEVDSTNTWVARRFDELDHHSLVYADVQLRGKGRGTRGWDSLIRGNLYMSLLVKDPSAVASRHAANFTQLIAVCARRAAAGFGADVGIKWPNDLFAGEGKIGGILSEARPWRRRPPGDYHRHGFQSDRSTPACRGRGVSRSQSGRACGGGPGSLCRKFSQIAHCRVYWALSGIRSPGFRGHCG